jgi:hypothetical protein
MKYLTGYLFAIALSLHMLHAQSNSFFIGANGGVNFSKFKHTVDLAELYSSSGSLTGLNGGVSAGFQIQHFTLSTGINYMQKGGRYETDNFFDPEGTGFFSAEEKLHYLSIPLLLGYRQNIGDRFGISLAMGPSFNLGLSGKVEESLEYYGSENISTEHYTVRFGRGVNDDYRNLQMGFQFSPGLYFDINDKSKLTFNVTWDSGLKDSFNQRYKQANTFFDDYRGNQFNRSTVLTIGYEYHFTFEDKY